MGVERRERRGRDALREDGEVKEGERVREVHKAESRGEGARGRHSSYGGRGPG